MHDQLSNIKVVDKAILSIDKKKTEFETIKMVAEQFDLVLANGIDQKNDTIPEKSIFEKVCGNY